jgi:hypothetical protein
MIKVISIKNQNEEVLTLNLRNPYPSGFFIKGVDGLGPVKATINTSESLSLDGALINSIRLGSRNIVFDLGFLENPTIEATRKNSYRFFSVKRQIEIFIQTDLLTVKTQGNIESNEPDIFSKEESAQVSVICPDPYFYSLEKTVVEFNNSTGSFEFPFSNESLSEKLLEFGTVNEGAESIAVYNGDAPIGITIYIHAVGEVGTLTIINSRTREVMTLDTDVIFAITGSGIIAGDDIIISTVKGKKSVTLFRDGEAINIFNALTPESVWFLLDTGDNPFFYTTDFGGSNISFRIEYDTIHEGI